MGELTPGRILRIKIVRTVAILLVLVGPVVFALLLRKGTSTYYGLPYIGPRVTHGTDTTLHRVPAPLAQPGTATLVLLYSPSCDSAEVTAIAGRLQATFGYLAEADNDLRGVLLATHPNDSLPRSLTPFVTYSPFDTQRAALLQGPLLLVRYSPQAPCSSLPARALLIDAEGHIRGVYPNLNVGYYKRLEEDVRTLRVERTRPQQMLPNPQTPTSLEDAVD